MKKQVLALALLAAFTLPGCATSYVQQGNVGLLIDNMSGKIDKTLEPGFRAAIPVGQHIIEFPVIKQQYVMVRSDAEGQKSGDDSVKVNSAEGQAFQIDASIEYQLGSKAGAAALYQRYAMHFDEIVDKYYRSKFRTAIINGFAQMPLAEGITTSGRKKAEAYAETELNTALKDDGIVVLSVMVREVHVPDAIASSIAAKTAAESELVKSRTVAQQKVVEAQAEANAAIAAAQGQARATTIRAEAESAANRKIAASLNGNLLRKMYIEKLSDKIQLVVPEKSLVNFGGLVPAPAAAAEAAK